MQKRLSPAAIGHHKAEAAGVIPLDDFPLISHELSPLLIASNSTRRHAMSRRRRHRKVASLARVIHPLDMALALLRPEIHFAQVAGAVALGQIGRAHV